MDLTKPRTFRTLHAGTHSRWLAASAILIASSMAWADIPSVVNYGVDVECTTSGQLCEPTFGVAIETTGELTFQFSNHRNACTTLGLLLRLDGEVVFFTNPPMGWNNDPDGRPTETPVVDLGPVAPGPHILDLQGYGLPVGCNDGHLENWAGTFTITTVKPDSDGDGRSDGTDNCPNVANSDQRDGDRDGIGDACDPCSDVDHDGFFAEEGCAAERDCNDSVDTVYPGAPEFCDGLANDCRLPTPPTEEDTDGDGWVACMDCDDGSAVTYPRAPDLCDGLNNDCDHPDWPNPGLLTVETDDDGDGYNECQGDCNDASATTYPGAPEACDAIDNDCSGQIDDGPDCDTSCDNVELIDTGPSPGSTLTWTGTELGIFRWEGPDIPSTRLTSLHRVDARGRSLGTSPIEVSPTYGQRILWTGSQYASLMFDDEERPHLVRYGLDGTLLAEPTLVTEARRERRGMWDLVWTGSEFGVLWGSWDDRWSEIRLQRLDANGRPIAAARLALTLYAYDWGVGGLRALWNGESYAVMFANPGTGYCDGSFFLAEVSVEGELLSLTEDCNSESSVLDFEWDGDDYGYMLINYYHPPCLKFRPGNRYPSSCDYPVYDGALEWTGSEWGVYWSQGLYDGSFFSRVSATGQQLAPDIDLSAPVKELTRTGSGFMAIGHQGSLLRIACNCADADEDGYSSCVECDDALASVNPDATEICRNGVDDDCDGAVDDGDPEGCENPLLAVIESFTADITPKGVVLRWRTAIEIDNAGFRLSRAGTTKQGQRAGTAEVALHDGFIPPKGNEMAGADYSFVDNAALPPGVYRYFLDDVDSHGRMTRHGPVEAEIRGRREMRRRQREP